MSKIICEVCGTAYPETATQCPVCGCVRSANANTVVEDSGADNSTSSYTYVKGGRFSKSNVRKHNKGTLQRNAKKSSSPQKDDDESKKKGFMIAGIVFLAVLIIVLIFIITRLLSMGGSVQNPATDPTQPSVPSSPTENSDPVTVPCEDIFVKEYSGTISSSDETLVLDVIALPSNCTDYFEFISSNPEIATVSSDGTIYPVSSGTATITIICGSQTKEFVVTCQLTPPAPDVTYSIKNVWGGNNKDVTARVGESFPMQLIDSDNNVISDAVWTSDNEQICVVTNGYVTVLGSGMTTVKVEYNGQTLSFVVRGWGTSTGTGSGGNVTEDGGEVTYFIKNVWGGSNKDVTANIDDTFPMQLIDSNNNVITDATWTSSDETICTVSNGNVTVKGVGTAEVTVEYQGFSASFIVRVHG